MANLNSEITVTALSSAADVTRTPLGKMLHVAADASFATQYAEYTTAAALVADTDVGADGQAAGAAFFAQSVHPPQLLIGKYTDSETLTTELDLILAAVQDAGDDFYVFTISPRTAAEVELAAAWASTNEKLLVYTTADADTKAATPGNIMETCEDASYPCVGIYHTEAGEYPDVALAAYKIAANPDEKVVAWYDAQLTGITTMVDQLTDAEWTTLQGYNGWAYLELMGSAAMGGGKLHDGNWVDEKISLDWFSTRLAEDLAQLRLNTDSLQEMLDPYNGGIGKTYRVVSTRVESAETIGHIAPGRTTITMPEPADITDRTATITIDGYMHDGMKTFSVTARLP